MSNPAIKTTATGAGSPWSSGFSRGFGPFALTSSTFVYWIKPMQSPSLLAGRVSGTRMLAFRAEAWIEPSALDAEAWPVVVANHIVQHIPDLARGLSLREEGAPGEIDMGAGGIFLTSIASGSPRYTAIGKDLPDEFPRIQFLAPIGPQGAQRAGVEKRMKAVHQLLSRSWNVDLPLAAGSELPGYPLAEGTV